MISPPERQSLSEVFLFFAKNEFRDYTPLYREIAFGIAADDALLAMCVERRRGSRRRT